jgi:hypothetical protein
MHRAEEKGSVIKKCFQVFVLAGWMLASPSFAHSPDAPLNLLASEFFSLMGKADFVSAARLFHYPPHYTPEERDADMRTVQRGLELFSREFGDTSRENIVDKPEAHHHVTVGGGDASYWKNYPSTARLVYDVQFGKEGSGYTVFSFCYIADKWEIRSAGYGLPMSREGSGQKIQSVLRQMIILFHPGSH